ncbi:hypothetical protein NPIL_502991 [Nephila pilipes]|uniref:Uncharacterized protein n=1 Tax=Nephila pilipes TaxID=299642 RepID=A0A8X6TT09_NEPPI|nr:hypothetical protein NPIL_502991 [Nephila pilipes]
MIASSHGKAHNHLSLQDLTVCERQTVRANHSHKLNHLNKSNSDTIFSVELCCSSPTSLLNKYWPLNLNPEAKGVGYLSCRR